jgi:hypothetical protein
VGENRESVNVVTGARLLKHYSVISKFMVIFTNIHTQHQCAGFTPCLMQCLLLQIISFPCFESLEIKIGISKFIRNFRIKSQNTPYNKQGENTK